MANIDHIDLFADQRKQDVDIVTNCTHQEFDGLVRDAMQWRSSSKASGTHAAAGKDKSEGK